MTPDFKIGDWFVRPGLHRIERGEDQRRLSPKAMVVLECLAENAGAVVEKESLVAAAWNGGYPTDEALATVVYELRKAFDDDARDPRVIETIRKRGFRIVATVEPIARPVTTHRRSWLAAALLLATMLAVVIAVLVRISKHSGPVAPIPAVIASLAVLPFTTLTNYDEDLLAAALGEMLISDLARACSAEIAPAIAVRERETWLLGDAARDLGADAVVEGSVLQSGTRVWISIQLVETSSGRMLWSASYERELGDELAVLREVALEIAQQIQSRISLPPVEHEGTAVPTARSLSVGRVPSPSSPMKN